MSEYTPSTTDVRHYYEHRVRNLGIDGYAAFNRWLAEHDRQVAERAWDEGHAEGFRESRALADRICFQPTTNPHRRQS